MKDSLHTKHTAASAEQATQFFWQALHTPSRLMYPGWQVRHIARSAESHFRHTGSEHCKQTPLFASTEKGFLQRTQEVRVLGSQVLQGSAHWTQVLAEASERGRRQLVQVVAAPSQVWQVGSQGLHVYLLRKNPGLHLVHPYSSSHALQILSHRTQAFCSALGLRPSSHHANLAAAW